MRRFLLLSAISMALSCGPRAGAETLSEEAKILGLLSLIEQSDVVFIRNGVEHAPREAAEHLRSKWQSAGGAIQTAEQFIDRLGSAS